MVVARLGVPRRARWFRASATRPGRVTRHDCLRPPARGSRSSMRPTGTRAPIRISVPTLHRFRCRPHPTSPYPIDGTAIPGPPRAHEPGAHSCVRSAPRVPTRMTRTRSYFRVCGRVASERRKGPREGALQGQAGDRRGADAREAASERLGRVGYSFESQSDFQAIFWDLPELLRVRHSRLRDLGRPRGRRGSSDAASERHAPAGPRRMRPERTAPDPVSSAAQNVLRVEGGAPRTGEAGG